MNNTILMVGRITKDIELRYTPNNKAVITVNLAIQNGKDDTTFLPITVFGNMAETTSKYCKKGDLIGIKGNIKNHNWQDKEGNTHYDYSFIAERVSFLSSKAKEIKQTSQTVEKKEEPVNDPFKEFGEQLEITDEFLD
jgi:single-strand DNA-binding protein